MKRQFKLITTGLLLIIAGAWSQPAKAWDFTNGKIIYFDNTVTNWSQAYIRVGRTDWNSAFLMSKVTGTQNLYTYTIPSWSGYDAFAIANNSAWTNANSIYNVCTGDSYEVTGSTVYQGYSISSDYTLIPTGVNNTDGCCTYYATSASTGLTNYTVTYSQPTGGSISVTYTNPSGQTGQNVSSGGSVVPTCIITVTATANSGYALNTLTVNGGAFTSGNTYVVRSNTTISATFNSKPTGVTLSATSSITDKQATLNGNIGTNGGLNITDYGFYYSTTNGFNDGEGTKSQVGTSNTTGAFSKILSGLNAGTTYYIKAYATNSIGTTYSTQGFFETSAASCSAPFTLNDTSITINCCDITKTLPQIVAASGSIPANAQYAWSPATGLSATNIAQPTFNGTSNQSYTVTVTDSEGICNASTTISVTYNNNLPTATLTTKSYYVTPDSIFTISNAQATGNYSWSCTGGSFSATSGTLAPSYTAPSTIGSYSIKLESPSVGTCQTAVDSAVVYVVNTPVLSATAATNVTGSTAMINASISSNGGLLPKEQGFFYSTSNLADFKTGTKIVQGDSAITTLNYQLTGLSLGTTYYYKAYVDNGLGITLSTNTENFTTAASSYRLEVTSGGKTFYSNELSSDGIFSLYTFKNSAIQLKQWEGGSWNYISDVTYTADSTVVQIPFTFGTETLGSPSEYTGNFYIRTDIATGGWSNYLDASKDNKMTFFTKYVEGPDLFSDTYDHYWVKWINLPGGTNLKAQVGNIYNSAISDFSDDYIVSGGGKYSAAGVRFSYDKKTNEITRYQLVTPTLAIGGQTPIDRKDWMYEYTFASAPNTIDVIGQNEWEGPTTYGTVNTVNCKLNGKRVRATFDYKTNRLTYGWLATNDPTSGTPNPTYTATVTDTIDADAVFISNEYGAAGLITDNCSIQVNGRIVVRKTYKTGEFGYWHWMSFPFDVTVKDLYGLDGYGIKYIIRKYDTAKRAKDGFEHGTNWAYLSVNDTLFANVGYSLGFSTNSSIQTGLNNQGEVTINFPSMHSGFLFSTEVAELHRSSTFLPDTTLSFSSFPDYTTEHTYRKSNQDWYLMGQPSFSTNKATAGPTYIIRHEGQKADVNDSIYGFVGYLASEYNIPQFQSYFIQYHGDIDFGNVTDAQHAPMRLASEQVPDEYYYLYLKNQNYSERTCFILAEDGQDAYEINKDLSKMLEENHYPQLYSTTGGYGLEFNHLPKTTQTVPLSVWIGNKGQFNFVLDKRAGQTATSVILTDILLEQQTDLMQTNYAVNFTTSGVTIANRFTITFDLTPKVVTDIPSNSASEISVCYSNGSIYIKNMPENASAYLVDMLGRKIESWTLAHEHLTLPQLTNGVYLLMIDFGSHQESHKLIIRE